MAKMNYLLGRAEKLVRKIEAPKSKLDKAHPYTFAKALKRVVPKMEATAKAIARLPQDACPDDEAVALLTIHPAYLAKSYFPDALLSEAHLRPVGSRSRIVSPDAWAIENPPESALTAEIFVAGKRKAFEDLPELVKRWSEASRGAMDLRKVENIRDYPVDERIRTPEPRPKATAWEVILHATNDPESDYILEGFRSYLKELDIDVDLERRLHAQGLCFLPVRAPQSQVSDIAKFSFIRAVREMPRMRPVIRVSKSTPSFKVELPNQDAVDPTIRVGVFDGGMPTSPDLSRWAQRKRATGIGTAHPELVEHGLGVTSAILFGPLEEGGRLPRPYANVEHYRVLDRESAEDDTEDYFDIIRRILDILDSGQFDFVNFSIGPDLPIEDDNVHVWTAMLDQFLRKGTVLAGIAVGNSGEKDHESGNARIQSPADCVNALAVGSADRIGDNWRRSAHSSIGPGRSPGRIKPDVLSFGGSARSPFYVIGSAGSAVGKLGTSFALPTAMRAAIGVRAHLGPIMSPLALKALLVHRADPSDHPQVEVGWGKVPELLEELIANDDTSAHIVYQGQVGPGEWVRAPIPVPEITMNGMVEIKATICYSTETDPQDPIHYTRSGVEIRFRPHSEKVADEGKKNAKTRPFFSAGNLYDTEQELRADAHKWETTLHASKRMRGTSIHEPYFDIHYQAREGGGKAGSAPDITYAMIVSLHAPKMEDLYDRIFRRYRTVLEALRPVVEIPIRGA